MSLYAINDSTLTALGDAIRSKAGKYIYKDTPVEQPIYSIEFDSRDYDIVTEWKYSTGSISYYDRINIPLKELLGDTLSMYNQKGVIGRPKFLINFTYESNMEKSLDCDFCVSPTTGGIWRDRLVRQDSTFLSTKLIDRLLEPSNNSRDFTDSYFIQMEALKTSVEQGFWFKFHFDMKILTPDSKFVYLNTYTPLEMVDAINSLEIPNIQPIKLTENCAYACAGPIGSAYINFYGDTITTYKVGISDYMFNNYTNETIPFEINYNISATSYKMNYMFSNCKYLRELPKVNGARPEGIEHFFDGCQNLREIPEDFTDSWDWSRINSYNYAGMSYIFNNCYSLRKIPANMLKNLYNTASSVSYILYNYGWNSCFVLDELIDIPIATTKAMGSNVFVYAFANCQRLKDLMFQMNEDGTPLIVSWKSQTIDLSNGVGYSNTIAVLNYNSGITADKEVTDDATYQALKNDPDWWSQKLDYSRYNRTSAVNTINSLPDCSAYGTNTIKFKGASGALTDGGAINTLTEEEIAVASAKGWTVTLL